MTPQLEQLLRSILSQPSSPFRERHVIRVVTAALSAAKVPHFSDPVGNIIVGAQSKAEYLKLVSKKTQDPLRIFVAHMDHPGFHGVSWQSPELLEVKWHGGSPTQHLEGATVWLANELGWVGSGVMTQAKLIKSERAIDSAVIKLDPKTAGQARDAKTLYGGFSFRAPVWEENNIFYTKAADDLVGTFAITQLAIDLWTQKRPARSSFLAVLTRAEEVGFIGAVGHFELGWLKKPRRPFFMVSLETSRTLPGAEIGKGPVIRLGDRTTVFDSDALRVFTQVATKEMSGKFQKRVMDGGTCEATAATAYGYPSIGISVPLGNYHNQGFEGGPDCRAPMGPAPEFVHRDDIQGLLELCGLLLKSKLPWNEPWKDYVLNMKKEYRAARELLRSGP